MVGLPYPNIYSPELKEKMTYLDSTLGVSFSLCFDYFCQNRREITHCPDVGLEHSNVVLISSCFEEVFQITISRDFISLSAIYCYKLTFSIYVFIFIYLFFFSF